MKSRMSELNDHLFAQLGRLSEVGKTPEQLEEEVKRADAIVAVAGQIISNNDTAIKAAKLVADHGDRFKGMMPLLEGKPE